MFIQWLYRFIYHRPLSMILCSIRPAQVLDNRLFKAVLFFLEWIEDFV